MKSNVTETKSVTKSALRRRLIRSLLVGVGFVFAVVLGFRAVQKGPREDQAPSIIRRNFEFSGQLWQKLQSNERLSGEYVKPPAGKRPRVNGFLGLRSEIDFLSWQLSVESGKHALKLKLDQITSLPKTNVTTDFKCIEGWSEVFHYSGLLFSEFMRAFGVGTKPDGSLYKYVGLETPDKQYYVSIDMESMLHPQTVLVYEMNEAPLRLENGAPLRLIIPVKYGIKSLKRIGRIFFTDERPPDYWAERGYDWYSGL